MKSTICITLDPDVHSAAIERWGKGHLSSVLNEALRRMLDCNDIDRELELELLSSKLASIEINASEVKLKIKEIEKVKEKEKEEMLNAEIHNFI